VKKALYAILFGVVFIAGYYAALKVEIGPCSVRAGSFEQKEIALPYRHASDGRKTYEYRCNMTPSLIRDVRIGIGADDRLLQASINGAALDFSPLFNAYRQKKLENWEQGYPFDIMLLPGTNELKVVAQDYGYSYGLSVSQNIRFIDFLLFFLFGAAPILYGLFVLVFMPVVNLRSLPSWPRKLAVNAVIPVLLIAAVAVRFFYLTYVPNEHYQHDMHEHMLAIKYYAEQPLDFPQPDKLGEAPQQPLYYWISGAIYKSAVDAGLSEHDAVFRLRDASFVYMTLWLALAYLLISRLSTSRTVRAIYLIFVGFTPSFVYLSGGVNNDVLNALWGVSVFYFAVRFWQERRSRWLLLAAAGTLLAMLTKISSVLLVIFLAVLLIVMYREATDGKVRLRLQKQMWRYGLAVAFVFGFALWKVYIPVSHEFRFVNGGLFAGQIVPALDMSFFFSFRLGELIRQAHSSAFGMDEVRYSFFTFLYGSFFFGEYSFSHLFKDGSLFKLASQTVILTGTLYLIGTVTFLATLRRRDWFERALAIAVLINLLLVLRHLLGNWDVCNYDFRFMTPTFAAVGVMVAMGLSGYLRFSYVKRAVTVVAAVLLIAEIGWLATVIAHA